MLRVPIAGKRVKIFKKRTDEEPYVTLDNTDNEEQSDEDRGDARCKESGLQLIVDIRGESEEASDEDGYEESRTSAHTGGCAGSEGASVGVYFVHYVKKKLK